MPTTDARKSDVLTVDVYGTYHHSITYSGADGLLGPVCYPAREQRHHDGVLRARAVLRRRLVFDVLVSSLPLDMGSVAILCGLHNLRLHLPYRQWRLRHRLLAQFWLGLSTLL